MYPLSKSDNFRPLFPLPIDAIGIKAWKNSDRLGRFQG